MSNLVLTKSIVIFTLWIDHVKSALAVLGEFSVFGAQAFMSLKRIWRRRGAFLRQCEFIGVTSTIIISVAAVFMGGVLGYQLYVSFHYFGAEALLGGSVGISLFRELGPVMASIMVTGRAGAAMAAEIASMRISEQVDALEVMAVNPIEYLVTPRVLAGILMMPLLSVYFAMIGSIAASFVACGVMDLSASVYWHQFAKVVDAIDLTHCVTKGAFFGLVLTWIGCFCGYRAQGGASAVGNATRNSVVASCLTILLMDYILTSMLPFGFATLSVN